MTRSIKRIIRKIQSDKIQNKIESGKITFFLNPLEEIAFKFVPGKLGKSGKYYAKYYGQNEFEIDGESNSVLKGVMDGKPIRRSKYDHYQLGEGGWNKDIKDTATYKVVSAYYNISAWLTRGLSGSGR